MSTILLDVGNSRTKWAESEGGGIGPMTVVDHGGNPEAALSTLLQGRKGQTVALVDVTGAAEAVARSHGPVAVMKVTAEASGVRNGYLDPSRLGADRWAALIGARRTGSGPTVVVDAGSALTVDLLDGEGVHLGGWIAPGLGLALQALRSGTRRMPMGEISFPNDGNPGHDTDHAVASGVVAAAVGLIRHAAELLPDARLVLTGGDAQTLRPALGEGEVVEDLVLRGLAAWTRDHG